MSPRMGNVTQLVECLISMCEAPDSIPRTGCNGGTSTLVRWRQKGQEFRVLLNLNSIFKLDLGNMGMYEWMCE